MAGIGLTTLDTLIKDLYLPAVTAQLNNEIILGQLFGIRAVKVSWQKTEGGVLWVPTVLGVWERPIENSVNHLLWEQFTTIIEVPVMDTSIEKIIREYFLPVLSQHNIEIRRQPSLLHKEDFKMMCLRCGHVTRFGIAPLSMLRERSRENVEKFLREMVDQHFRPWEKVQCATEGTQRSLVAEWLTHRLEADGTLFDHQIGPALLEDGHEHWDPEFVLLIAEGLDFVDDLTEHHQGKMLLLPKAHPLAPR